MGKKYFTEDNEAIPAILYAESAPVGFTEITDIEKLTSLHAKRYELNRLDGVQYYNKFQAGLYLDILTGTYTVTEVVTLEFYLKDLGDQIKSGSWLTASQTIINLPLSGIFTQIMKDEIIIYINNYIAENY